MRDLTQKEENARVFFLLGKISHDAMRQWRFCQNANPMLRRDLLFGMLIPSKEEDESPMAY